MLSCLRERSREDAQAGNRVRDILSRSACAREYARNGNRVDARKKARNRKFWSVGSCTCACVCVCVCERERERERVCVCVCVRVRVCVRVCEGVRVCVLCNSVCVYSSCLPILNIINGHTANLSAWKGRVYIPTFAKSNLKCFLCMHQLWESTHTKTT